MAKTSVATSVEHGISTKIIDDIKSENTIIMLKLNCKICSENEREREREREREPPLIAFKVQCMIKCILSCCMYPFVIIHAFC